jgi:phosphohistidine swiveling domain-containing protein
MSLEYIQRKSALSSILWFFGCGLGMTHYPIRQVYAGFDLGETIWLVRQEEGFMCGDRATHFNKLILNFQNYIIKHPERAEIIKKIYLRRAVKLRSIINRLATYDYATASPQVLWADYQKITKVYYEVYPYSEPFAIAIGDLADKFKAEFLNIGLSVQQFEKLLLPPEQSFIQREQLNLFNLALNNRGIKVSSETNKKLYRHFLNWTWLPYDYGVTHYSLNHFQKEFDKILRLGKNKIWLRYRALKNYEKDLKQTQGIIIKKFRLSARQVSLIKIIQTAFFLVDSKKQLFTQLHWYSQNIFAEIGKRLNLPVTLAGYMLPAEVEACLIHKKIVNKKKIQDRYDNCVFRIKPNGSVNILSGIKAANIIDNFLKFRKVEKSSLMLKGRVANQGIARGRVRIIQDARRCDEFKHGEILVTAMTSPDYMFAVRRAAAIITDEGGVICHAAIISRELGLPCIVGTKFATKVLHDGDLVEVDAQKGIIKKL